MKRIFIFAVSFMLILAGMHFSIAMHYCNGKYSSSKITFGSGISPCCIEKQGGHQGTVLFSDCCDNEITTSQLDQHVIPDTQKKAPEVQISQNWFVHDYPAESSSINSHLNTCSSGPPVYPACSVDIFSLCILRI